MRSERKCANRPTRPSAGRRRRTVARKARREDCTLVAWYRSGYAPRGKDGRVTVTIGRRELLAALGGGAVAWPLAASAQQSAMPVIGFIDPSSLDRYAPFLAAFRTGLNEAGFVEGRNVAIELRWAEGHYDRLPALAADLVRRKVQVIVATGVTAALAAKGGTTTNPTLFDTGRHPVKLRLLHNS